MKLASQIAKKIILATEISKTVNLSMPNQDLVLRRNIHLR